MTELPGGDEIGFPVLNNFYQFVVLSLLLCWFPSCSLSPASPGRHRGNQGGSESAARQPERAERRLLQESTEPVPDYPATGSSCCCWNTRDFHITLLGYIPWCSALLKNHNFCLIRSFPAQLNSAAVHSSSLSSTLVFAAGTHCNNIFMFKHSTNYMVSQSFSVQELRETPSKNLQKNPLLSVLERRPNI